ncbi:sigma-70 family RNA polymerase sigma factor [Tumebacillus sp. DT12]|uniref:RNA polymerase sigma factor n=1 Tax=Tumebacillus lacus TaxID=2995335 RepID=A0ABT3WXG4_9BACL|nr:sigma-70 family RNA polymerase sigma factor [Tumebacillus lacus]MCX7569369.1 sigma-70 family RNA polymerase sigma factor [Tumebacillus lacus]
MKRDEMLREWIRAHGRMVIRTAYYYVKDKMIAEDIAQEVFLKAYAKIEEFRGTASVETWLYRITVNHCKDYVRSWAYRKLLVQQHFERARDEGDLPEDVLVKKHRGEELLAMVMKLPVKDREVILLHYFEELKVKEIAEILSDKETTVRVRMMRALKKLRQKVEEEEAYGLL